MHSGLLSRAAGLEQSHLFSRSLADLRVLCLRQQLVGVGAQGGAEPGVPEARWPLCSPPASHRGEVGKVA